MVSGRSLGAQKTVTSIAFLGQDHWTNPLQQNAVSVVPCFTEENPDYYLGSPSLKTCFSTKSVKGETNISPEDPKTALHLLGKSLI